VGKDIHTVYKDGQWQNKEEGNNQPLSTAATKEEAQAKGRELAMASGVEHHIHNQDGKIAERNSYGNDPRGQG
jgi:hypothetical protein